MAGEEGGSDRAGGPEGGWRFPLVRPSLPPLEQYRRELEPVWESRMLSNFGSRAQRLEQLVRSYTGQEHAMAVSSCDVGLTLAVAGLGLAPGTEAIVPSFTFNSTLNALLWNGLRPRFVDVDPGTYCLDPESVEAATDGSTGLIVGTHVFGGACDVAGLQDVAGRAGVPLVFDAAQAFATFVGGRHVAAFGDASVFSFSGTKIVTCAEGGIAVLRSAEMASAFAHLRSYGFQGDYVSRYVGLNGKLSELHAALGCLTVDRTEDEVAARERLVRRYHELLDGCPLRFQTAGPAVRSSCTYLAIEVPDRDPLVAVLDRARIQTKAYFRPLHHMSLFAGLPRGPLPVTERLGREVLCLPLYADLPEADVEVICAAVRDGLRSGRA